MLCTIYNTFVIIVKVSTEKPFMEEKRQSPRVSSLEFISAVDSECLYLCAVPSHFASDTSVSRS